MATSAFGPAERGGIWGAVEGAFAAIPATVKWGVAGLLALLLAVRLARGLIALVARVRDLRGWISSQFD
ncbi:hypothetical protein [Caldovatus aquaticus]|uniref:Mechanosensitive ion channel family protein n=1 Tax=Caldovatus aquaticus TaxID=2865671 RepID=A0ABS7F5M7_9PROT|nr:hypothetical protein [Caldovatus aquaticus]MBW8270924.1 hypothetical protein [Caldovatus aquaticus]